MSERLLLLHGFTGTPASWDDVVARLDADDVDVFAPALLGHDPAAFAEQEHDPSLPVTMGEEAFSILAQMEARFGREPVHVAGYSLGARIALMLVATAPELFRSAMLIGVNPGLRTDAERAERRAADRRWIELLEAGIAPFVDAWEKLPLWHTQTRVPYERLEAQRSMRMSHEPRGLAASLRATGLAEQPDLRPRLGDVHIPVALLVGEEDPKFRALAEESAALLPDARVVVVPDAGHNLLLERPEAVAHELNRTIR